MAQLTLRPDVILSDYNLPGRLNGLQLTAELRERLHRHIPAIILTGDISTATLRSIADQDCVQVNKPAKPQELMQLIQGLLAASRSGLPAPGPHAPDRPGMPGQPVIFVVDDDSHIRDGLRRVLEEDGRIVEDFATCEAFLKAYSPGSRGMPAGRCLPAGDERARSAATPG